MIKRATTVNPHLQASESISLYDESFGPDLVQRYLNLKGSLHRVQLVPPTSNHENESCGSNKLFPAEIKAVSPD